MSERKSVEELQRESLLAKEEELLAERQAAITLAVNPIHDNVCNTMELFAFTLAVIDKVHAIHSDWSVTWNFTKTSERNEPELSFLVRAVSDNSSRRKKRPYMLQVIYISSLTNIKLDQKFELARMLCEATGWKVTYLHLGDFQTSRKIASTIPGCRVNKEWGFDQTLNLICLPPKKRWKFW